MGDEFDISKEVEIPGTPEQVWDAIATGPGISSWFMGPHEVEPRAGGRITMTYGDFSDASTITGWDPPKRLAYRGDPAEDGSFHAMEYLLEGRDGGSTWLRFVHSGITSDDWGDEFLVMTSYGWDLYLFTLGEYVKHFSGRYATYEEVPLPPVPDGVDMWSTLSAALGLPVMSQVGDRVRMRLDGAEPVDGVVDFAPGFPGVLGIRGEDAFYRFHGPNGIGLHLFDGDPQQAKAAWQRTFNNAFA
ncbi:SRPBCC domain-containing protein [Fodinicola acaciae]|uniref:SRPBCC domain-containing protein n=1 Tax=Fodinicola acaciae TaxID=2681555 RepID=UPI0013D6EA3A|nr:SRPBCC domain-containing protein [Fodinicola acaciae]